VARVNYAGDEKEVMPFGRAESLERVLTEKIKNLMDYVGAQKSENRQTSNQNP
jgi:hypothetical protein